jgi:hypothetical protein
MRTQGFSIKDGKNWKDEFFISSRLAGFSLHNNELGTMCQFVHLYRCLVELVFKNTSWIESCILTSSLHTHPSVLRITIADRL